MSKYKELLHKMAGLKDSIDGVSQHSYTQLHEPLRNLGYGVIEPTLYGKVEAIAEMLGIEFKPQSEKVIIVEKQDVKV